MSIVVKNESQLVSTRELITVNSMRITVWIGADVNTNTPFHIGGHDDSLQQDPDFEKGGQNSILLNENSLQTGNP